MNLLPPFVESTLRRLRILPTPEEKGEEGDVSTGEGLKKVDELGEQQRQRAENNLPAVKRGELTEEQFYERVLGLGDDEEV